ncbi:tRNA lysidine(34) synthetase TilS [Apibacter raozihei]|uniref:tRNA lysidine(34) synthetase TilS n=1 Tax=Apibacter raozihei TaxID=2500547 RepID=UPI000FE2B295|nr:tRNA lysidine(34) synthetase TilS [Apibacter raozihei]
METIHKALDSLNKNKKYLLAVSGGADSMVLLDLFVSSDLNYSVVHCNFQLRGEDSLEDENLVRNYCDQKGIELFVRRFDTLSEKKNRESVEMTARKLRYDYFFELCKNQSFDYIVTAHHLNDQAETFFINLLRGSGLKGLSGMNYLAGRVLRPLLNCTQKEIISYALNKKILWREDHTNQELDYLRNKIRHIIIPELQNMNQAFLPQIKKSMQIIDSSHQFIIKKSRELAEEALINNNHGIKLFDREQFKKSDFILVYLIFSEFGFTDENDVNNILKASTGSTFQSKTHKIWIDRKHLIIEPIIIDQPKVFEVIDKIPLQDSFPLPLKLSLEVSPDNGMYNEMIDWEKVKLPIYIRNWQEGDYFYPINGNGKKKISKYLKDLKISVFNKTKVLVLCNADGKIIWLINYRLDNRFKVTTTTTKYLGMSFVSNEGV